MSFQSTAQAEWEVSIHDEPIRSECLSCFDQVCEDGRPLLMCSIKRGRHNASRNQVMGFTYFSQAGPLGVRLPCNQMRQMRSSAMHYIAPGRYSYDLISVACRRSTRQK
jgi:hypothetical protein